MSLLYVRETTDEPLAKAVYQTLREYGVDVTLTDHLSTGEVGAPVIILGGEFLTDITNLPSRYIIVQTVPTSPLTLTNKTEAYWIQEEYIQILKGAEAVWDVSHENVRVWKEFYGLEEVYPIPLGFRSSFLVPGCPIPDDLLPPSRKTFTIIDTKGTRRGDEFYQRHRSAMSSGTSFHLESGVAPLELIKKIHSTLTQLHPTVIVLAPYEQTYPDLSLCALLRYNGIECVVEQSRDVKCNHWLESMGCRVVPWVRLDKYLAKTIKALPTCVAIPPPRTPFILEHLICDLPKVNRSMLVGSTPGTGKKKPKKPKLHLYAREPVSDVHYELLDDGGITLKLGDVPDSDLPPISICTPTGNRRWVFSLAMRNVMTMMYPEGKYEWVILDDGDESMEDIIPRDPRIRYHYIPREEGEPRISVAEKRNRLVELAEHDHILFMDDDDYYPPESMLARAKALVKYADRGVECVGCRDVASYDLSHGLCAICSNGDSYLTESSLAFTRAFWLERPFNTGDYTGEYRHFLEYRQDRVKSLPFQFVTIALTHGHNTTGDVRSLDFYRKWRPSEDWEGTKKSILDALDEETQEFLVDLKRQIPKT